MAISPISGTDVVSYIAEPNGTKSSAQIVIPVTADGVSAGPVTSSTATVTSVASGIASVTIKAANTSRKGISVLNTDANALYLLVGGGTASATNLSVIVAATNGYWEAPFGFTGEITGIWAADGTGSAFVTEYT